MATQPFHLISTYAFSKVQCNHHKARWPNSHRTLRLVCATIASWEYSNFWLGLMICWIQWPSGSPSGCQIQICRLNQYFCQTDFKIFHELPYCQRQLAMCCHSRTWAWFSRASNVLHPFSALLSLCCELFLGLNPWSGCKLAQRQCRAKWWHYWPWFRRIKVICQR